LFGLVPLYLWFLNMDSLEDIALFLVLLCGIIRKKNCRGGNTLKKNLPFLVLFIVVALVIGGYLGYSTFKGESKQPEIRDVKVPQPQITGDDSSSNGSSQNGGKEKKEVSLQTIEETNVPNADPKSGELIVWGEVKAVDIDKRVLTVDQEMDDNSVKISPNVPVNKEAIIRNKEQVISLGQVKPGDSVGIIVTKEGHARAVLVNY